MPLNACVLPLPRARLALLDLSSTTPSLISCTPRSWRLAAGAAAPEFFDEQSGSGPRDHGGALRRAGAGARRVCRGWPRARARCRCAHPARLRHRRPGALALRSVRAATPTRASGRTLRSWRCALALATRPAPTARTGWPPFPCTACSLRLRLDPLCPSAFTPSSRRSWGEARATRSCRTASCSWGPCADAGLMGAQAPLAEAEARRTCCWRRGWGRGGRRRWRGGGGGGRRPLCAALRPAPAPACGRRGRGRRVQRA